MLSGCRRALADRLGEPRVGAQSVRVVRGVSIARWGDGERGWGRAAILPAPRRRTRQMADPSERPSADRARNVAVGPRHRRPDRRTQGTTMLALVYGLIEGSTGWTAVPIACLVAGGGFLVAFAIRQRPAGEPLILPRCQETVASLPGGCSGCSSSQPSRVWCLSPRCTCIGAAQQPLECRPGPVADDGRRHDRVDRQPPRAIATLGRWLVLIGLTLTGIAAVDLWPTVHVGETGMSQRTSPRCCSSPSSTSPGPVL